MKKTKKLTLSKLAAFFMPISRPVTNRFVLLKSYKSLRISTCTNPINHINYINMPIPELRQIERNEWPKLINEIAEFIGDEAAMNLFVHFAGTHFRVPKNYIRNPTIISLIGEEKALIFSRVFGDSVLGFPLGHKQLIKLRNRKIIEAWKSGITRGQIAQQHKLSDRQIGIIITKF
jgi:hypothetical protein